MFERIAPVIGLLLLMLCVPVATALALSGSPLAYAGAQRMAGVPSEEGGLSDTERWRANWHLIRYLRGTQADLDDTYEGADEARLAFSPQEQWHMMDVRALLQRTTRAHCALCVSGLALIMKYPPRRKNECRIAAGMAAGILVGVGAWSLVDFECVFTGLHEWWFDNALWRLDESSLLIRLMPMPFFVSMAAVIGGATLSAIAWVGARGSKLN